jgi:hypothetical protein
MSRRSLLLTVVAILPLAGCAAEIAASPGSMPTVGASATLPGPTAAEPGAPVAAGPAYGPNEDRQWFQPDDYLISDQPYESGYIYVKLAKMKQAPSPASKNEGLFFSLTESKDIWTPYFWRTRPAEQPDLVMGAQIICFEGNGDSNSVYQAPRDKENARRDAWFLSRITDLSDLYKGAVGVDTYKCSPAALRVPVR